MNLLTDELFAVDSQDGCIRCSLPGVYGLLAVDRVECFSALRAHQEPAWHMFLAQLGAVAMHRAGMTELPMDEAAWRDIIRALTKDAFPDDEPWRLVVEDLSKPAFMQPPVPADVNWTGEATTPDALDMLYTSKNHDVKSGVAYECAADDWIYALIVQQTFDGALTNNPISLQLGIARMNSGDGGRPSFGIAPMSYNSAYPRWGRTVSRDIKRLVMERSAGNELWTTLGLGSAGQIAITWAIPWYSGQAIKFSDLDPLFIEICRVIRLKKSAAAIVASRAGSPGRRIDSTHTKGVMGDPWAPINKLPAKSANNPTQQPTVLTPYPDTVQYAKLANIIFNEEETSHPICMQLADWEDDQNSLWCISIRAMSRKKGHQTDGYIEKLVPFGRLGARRTLRARKELKALSEQQIAEIEQIQFLLETSIGIFIRGGVELADLAADRQKAERDKQRRSAAATRARLDTVADRLFFPALWARFEVEQAGDGAALAAAEDAFVRQLIEAARQLFEEGLADIPCRAIHRPRAEARARRRFDGALRNPKSPFSRLFAAKPSLEDDVHADSETV
jgi:CRISPR system Cascade subunit CasA